MRFYSVLLLVLSMICGTALTMFIGRVWFPIKQETVKKEVVQAQVLVAKNEIPAGTALYADQLEFRLVSVESISIGVLTEYSSVCGRKTLFPISKGEPISDLDLESTVTQQNAVADIGTITSPVAFSGSTEIPEGLYAFPVRIDRIHAGDATGNRGLPANTAIVNVSTESLSSTIHPGDKVDLFLLKAAKKINVREAGIPKDSLQGGGDYVFHRSPPEKLISSLEVYGSFALPTESHSRPALSLLMTKEQIELAKNAAKQGRLQVRLTPRETTVAFEGSEALPTTDSQNTTEETGRNEMKDVLAGLDEHSARVAMPSPPLGEQQKHYPPIQSELILRKTAYSEPGRITPVSGSVPGSEQRIATSRTGSRRGNSNRTTTEGTVKSKPSEAPPQDPIPDVIHIGVRSSKKVTGISSSKDQPQVVSSTPSKGPAALRISSSTRLTQQSRFASRSSDAKSGGEQPPVEVYSFEAQPKRKTDLFPKYMYESTAIPLTETDRFALK